MRNSQFSDPFSSATLGGSLDSLLTDAGERRGSEETHTNVRFLFVL